MDDVKGKWTLITGASRGIGYEIAEFMAKSGRLLPAREFTGMTLEDAVRKAYSL
ncbi:MAG: hypothetical protein WCG21_00025 [Eubacteriales bacterium]